MGEQKSNYAVFKYGSNKVGKITSISLSIDGNVIESNSFDTGAITQAILGRRTVTISMQGNLDWTDSTGQVLIMTDFLDSANELASDFEAWEIEPETPASGDVTYSGAAIVTNYTEDRSGEGDELAKFSTDLRVTSFTRAVTS